MSPASVVALAFLSGSSRIHSGAYIRPRKAESDADSVWASRNLTGVTIDANRVAGLTMRLHLANTTRFAVSARGELAIAAMEASLSAVVEVFRYDSSLTAPDVDLILKRVFEY